MHQQPIEAFFWKIPLSVMYNRYARSFLVFLFLLLWSVSQSIAQPRGVLTGFFKHEMEDSTTVYLRFTPIPLPDGHTLRIVQTWSVHDKTGECAYFANDYRMEGNKVKFPISKISWHINFNLDTETLTVSFPENTLVFWRAPPDNNPIVDCRTQTQKV